MSDREPTRKAEPGQREALDALARQVLSDFVREGTALEGAARDLGMDLPMAFDPDIAEALVPFFARAWQPSWYVSPSGDPDAHVGLRRLKEREKLGWYAARRLALEAGFRLAWAAHTRPRRVRLARNRWIRDDEGEITPHRIRALPGVSEAMRHLRRETRRAAADWLAERTYHPGPRSDRPDEPLEEAEPLFPTLAADDQPAAALLEAVTEDSPLVAAARDEEERTVLTDAHGRQREILQVLQRYLRAGRSVAEAKCLAAEELDITPNAIQQHFRRLRNAV